MSGSDGLLIASHSPRLKHKEKAERQKGVKKTPPLIVISQIKSPGCHEEDC